MPALPTFPVNGHPTGAQMTSLLPTRAAKAADTSTASSIVLVADPDLLLPVAATSEYEVTLHVIYTAGGTGLITVGFTGPAGATFDWYTDGLANTVTATDSGIATFLARALTDTKNLGAAGAATPVVTRISGRLVTSVTAGTLTFRWAQSVSSATGTTVKAGSFMVLRQIA